VHASASPVIEVVPDRPTGRPRLPAEAVVTGSNRRCLIGFKRPRRLYGLSYEAGLQKRESGGLCSELSCSVRARRLALDFMRRAKRSGVLHPRLRAARPAPDRAAQPPRGRRASDFWVVIQVASSSTSVDLRPPGTGAGCARSRTRSARPALLWSLSRCGTPRTHSGLVGFAEERELASGASGCRALSIGRRTRGTRAGDGRA